MKVTKTILLLLAVANAQDNQEGADAGNQDPAGAENNQAASENQNPDPSGAENQDGAPAAGDQSQSNTESQDSNQTSDSTDADNQDNSGAENQESQNSEAQDGAESDDGSQANEEQPACPTECGADEVCATLTSVIDIDGNTLPENHPNFGAKENKCTAKAKCGTNFQDESENFFSAECPQADEPESESDGTGNQPESAESEDTVDNAEEQSPDSNDGPETAPDDPLLLPNDDSSEEAPIDAIDVINAENEIRDSALEAEAAAITLAQKQVSPGESGGSCGLSDQKCNYADICCGVGENALGGRLENICGNGRGPNEPMSIGGISYNHVCGSMKLLASLGSIAAALYMM